MGDRIRGTGKQGIVAGLDIGSTKITCFVAKVMPVRADGEPDIKVLGVGHQISRGVKKGVVVDIQSAEEAIRGAVDTAERMAGVVVQKVWVNLTHPSLESHHAGVETQLSDREVAIGDLRRVTGLARASVPLKDRTLLHALPLGFSIDGSKGISDPRGMLGQRLGVTMHLISTSSAPLRNLAVAIKRCHLEVAGYVAAPYASALAALVPDEFELGTTLIDMGGGSTTVSIFFDGHVMYTDVVPVGGQHVTSDLARGLSTPLSDAERMKTLYGSALPSPSDDRELIDVPQIGEDFDGASNQVPRSVLTGIIAPRVEETLELVRERVAQSGFEDVAGRRVVLTGGASQLTGVRELASRMLNKPVRTGRPVGFLGVPDSVNGPAFTGCAGLVAYPSRAPREASKTEEPAETAGSLGQIGQIGRWLKANF